MPAPNPSLDFAARDAISMARRMRARAEIEQAKAAARVDAVPVMTITVLESGEVNIATREDVSDVDRVGLLHQLAVSLKEQAEATET
jgi:DNA-binding XRE family transcriptional regulator